MYSMLNYAVYDILHDILIVNMVLWTRHGYLYTGDIKLYMYHL